MKPGLAARILGLGVVLAFVASAAWATVQDPQPDDMALGHARAPVTVIEYASTGCPHCAAWSNDVFPAFKARYIDTGKVRFVLRELITGDPALATAGFMMARCAGPERYFPVVEAIFHRQASMYGAGASRGAILENIAKTAGGLDEDAFKACITDQKGLDGVNDRSNRHGATDGIASTPTFFVGDQLLQGDVTMAQLDVAIRAARHGKH
jgi:protein-disulfide isomerase